MELQFLLYQKKISKEDISGGIKEITKETFKNHNADETIMYFEICSAILIGVLLKFTPIRPMQI